MADTTDKAREALMAALLAKRKQPTSEQEAQNSSVAAKLADALRPTPAKAPKLSNENVKVLLQGLLRAFAVTHNFEPGSFVRWKPGLKNRKFPEYDQPAIVVKVLAIPLISEETDSGSPYFQEPLDLVLGILDDENEFGSFYFDKRRFEPFV